MEQNVTDMTQKDDVLAILAILASLDDAEQEETAVVVKEEADVIDLSDIVKQPKKAAAVSDEDVSDEDLKELTEVLARQAAYEAQESTIDPTPLAVTEPVKKAKAPRAPKAAKTSTGTTRTPRKSLADIADAVFEIVKGAPIDKAAVLAKRPIQVKIAEKFDNLFIALDAGKEPSSYIVSAMKLLNAQKTIKSSDLIGAYHLEGLGDGTARSQTGQIMELFNVVGIAARSGQMLTLREDSSIAERLTAIINKASQPTTLPV